MSEHEHVMDFLPAYAVGSLEEEERGTVDRHLSACEACRTELLAFQAVTDQLALAVPLRTPPQALKNRVLEGVMSKSRQTRPARAQGGLQSLLRILPAAWSVASLVVILALAASNLFLWRQVDQLREAANPTEFQTLAMVGTGEAPDASGIVVISPDGRYGTVVVEQMPQLDEDHQYQVWLIKDGNRTSGGVFSVGRTGYGYLYVRSPEPLASYTSFGITIEPAGGSPGPTGAKVLGSAGQ
jgi:anti-sigma-K factor RskA